MAHSKRSINVISDNDAVILLYDCEGILGKHYFLSSCLPKFLSSRKLINTLSFFYSLSLLLPLCLSFLTQTIIIYPGSGIMLGAICIFIKKEFHYRQKVC